MTQVNGAIAQAGDIVQIGPGNTDTAAVAIITGNYTGVEGVFETSPDGTAWTPIQGIYINSYQPDGPYISPQSGTSQSWGFNITVANKFLRLRTLAYGSGTASVIWVSAVVAGGIPILTAPTPTPVDRSAQGAAAAIAPAMPAVSGKTNFVQRIYVDGKGATAGSVQAATLNNVQVNGVAHSLLFLFVVPAGINNPLGGGMLDITFDPPLRAVGTNTAVTLSVPSFGSGNTLAVAGIQGYVQ